MKLATFRVQARATWGVVHEDRVFDVGGLADQRLSGLRQVVELSAYGDVARACDAAASFACSEIEWLPVIPDPQKIICVGLNYEAHRLETGRSAAGHPAIFTRFADSQLGHNQPILRPRVSQVLDYEGELAVIIGKAGRYIPAEDAMSHIAGYACYNDASIRDWQQHNIQFTPGKNFPRTGAFGPWMVTADEIADVSALRLTTRLNGQTVQDAGLDQLIFTIPMLIEYCSAFTPLSPGDVIVTGTPGGVGFKRTPQLLLKPGDQVEVDIPGVGCLVNGVVDE
jgi:2-keto-4-pentenoate hydratase/2-oxohepta-3-ene-1,7-dioic acid hydratase in catechol pathway